MRDRFAEFTAAGEGHPQIVLSLGKVGLDRQGREVVRCRLVQLSAANERQTQIVMGGHAPGLDR